MAADTNDKEALCFLCGGSSRKVGKIAVAEGRADGICRGCFERCRAAFKQGDYLPVYVRKAQEADLDDLMAIESTVDTRFSTIMTRREALDEILFGHVYLLCRKDTGAVCGHIMYEHRNTTCLYISGFALHPAVQGRGVGTQALRYVIERFGNLPRIELLTQPANVRAVSRYLSAGFVVESVLPRPFDLAAGPRLLLR